MKLSQKRATLITVISLLTVLLSLSSAVAATPRPPVADASSYINDPTLVTNDDRLRVEAGTPSCDASRTRISFVKWNLASISQVVGNATMSYVVQSLSLGNATAGNQSMILYATTDGWQETTLNWGNQPALGSQLGSAVVTGAGTTISFTGANLTNYINAELAGDKVVSFALALSGNCGEASVILRLYSKDSTVAGVQPDLQLFTPTAVDVSKASAERTSWPLYAGLGALALVVIAGVMISRRKMA